MYKIKLEQKNTLKTQVYSIKSHEQIYDILYWNLFIFSFYNTNIR